MPGTWIYLLDADPDDWEGCGAWLEAAVEASRPIVLVPSGGRFAEAVRGAADEWRLPEPVARRMSLSAMDQHGLMLHGVCPGLHVAADETRLRALARAGRTAVWLPSAMVAGRPELDGCREAEADSLAAWLAAELGAEALVLVKAGPCGCACRNVVTLAREGLVDAAFPAWSRRFAGEARCVRRDDRAGMAAALRDARTAGCRLGRAGALDAA